MAYDDRKIILSEIEKLRRDRPLLCFFNFDRHAEPAIPGLSTSFNAEVKEALFRVLKESAPNAGVDVCLYTRGGDTNAVWPIVSLIREFDPDFEVLVPFRCHSGGTLVALGACRICMGPISELSPIDPSTGNQFNPRDPADPRARMAISVEDVRAYQSFVAEQFKNPSDQRPFIERLTGEVHPLALGNVQRVLIQIKQLATNLLSLHSIEKDDPARIVEALTTRFYSHLHMISRHEAREILGERVEFASPELAIALDKLLRSYEKSFRLRHTFFLSSYLKGKQEADVRFIGGAVESKAWSYVFETKANVRQHVRLPSNVQIQIPFGQPMPLVPGLPRDTEVEVTDQGWVANPEPLGVTS